VSSRNSCYGKAKHRIPLSVGPADSNPAPPRRLVLADVLPLPGPCRDIPSPSFAMVETSSYVAEHLVDGIPTNHAQMSASCLPHVLNAECDAPELSHVSNFIAELPGGNGLRPRLPALQRRQVLASMFTLLVLPRPWSTRSRRATVLTSRSCPNSLPSFICIVCRFHRTALNRHLVWSSRFTLIALRVPSLMIMWCTTSMPRSSYRCSKLVSLFSLS